MNNDYISTAPLYYDTYLAHHGIKGQKWGERKYQYEDGSLTPEGKLRYLSNSVRKGARLTSRISNITKKLNSLQYENGKLNANVKTKFGDFDLSVAKKKPESISNTKKNTESNKYKKIAKAAAIAAGTVAAGALLYKFGPKMVSSIGSSAIRTGQTIAESPYANDERVNDIIESFKAQYMKHSEEL